MRAGINAILLTTVVVIATMAFFKDRTPAALPDPGAMHVATLAAG